MITEEPTIIRQQWWVVRALVDYRSNLIAVTAGLGSGKTHGACQWLYDRIALNIQRKTEARYWAYMMPIYELIHNTAIPTFEKVLDSYGFDCGPDYEVIKSPFPKLIFKQRPTREIHFLSANRPEKIKSVEYADAVADEPGVTKRESFDRLRERVRAKAVTNQILLPGTPEGLNWFADEFDSDKADGWDRSKKRDHTLSRVNPVTKAETRLRRFRLTTFDNKLFLPEGYIEGLFDTHRANEAYIQSYIYGHFVALVTGNCYSNYKPQLHDWNDIEADPARDVEFTWDFNADPLAWVIVQRFAFDEYDKRVFKRVAIHNSDAGSSTLEDACVEFASRHPVDKFRYTLIKLYGDSSGHAESHKTRRTDYQAIQHYLKVLGYERVQICALRHNPLETMSVDALNRWFLGNELLVCKRCTKFRRSLMATRWKDGERKIEKKAGETHTHHGDAVKYLAYAIQHEAGNKILSSN